MEIAPQPRARPASLQCAGAACIAGHEGADLQFGGICNSAANVQAKRLLPCGIMMMPDKYFGAHEFQPREEAAKPSSDRSFGLVFAGFFAVLAALGFWHGSGAGRSGSAFAAYPWCSPSWRRMCWLRSTVFGRSSGFCFTRIVSPVILRSSSTAALRRSDS